MTNNLHQILVRLDQGYYLDRGGVEQAEAEIKAILERERAEVFKQGRVTEAKICEIARRHAKAPEAAKEMTAFIDGFPQDHPLVQRIKDGVTARNGEEK